MKSGNANVLVTGSSGLIGQALCDQLTDQGHHVIPLLRGYHENSAYWQIEEGVIKLNGQPEPDIIIHLAGENIANARWTDSIKQTLINSRVNSTQCLVDFINNSDKPPSLFICASAIGFYGDSAEHCVDEQSSPGKGFVSQLAMQWEEVSLRANTRVINLRTGIVLSTQGGALQKMLTPFKMGLGGKIGNGLQMMSWIDLQDEINAIQFLMEQDGLSGPFNLVSPNAVSNHAFALALAKILNRPCLFPLPEFMVKALFGEMGKTLLLESCHVQPTKLQEAGFQFQYAHIEHSLKHQLHKYTL